MAIINTLKQRYDGFINAISGVGTSRDISSSNRYISKGVISQKDIDDLYAESNVFAKIIDIFPETGLANWIDFTHDRKEQIDDAIEELDIIEALERAAKKERKDGGSVMYCDVDDGQKHDQPLNLDRVTAFNAVTVYEGKYVSPINPDRSGLAEVYQISGNGETIYIHRSRLILFQGIEISDDYHSRYAGMCRGSVSARIYDSCVRYEGVQKSVASLVHKLLIGVWKMFDLNLLIDSDDDEDYKARLEAQRQGVSLINDVVIDSQDEYNLLTPTLSGVKEITEPVNHNLVAVSDLPHTKLLGESPGASLGASGGSQERDFKKSINSYQRKNLKKPIAKVLNMITASLNADKVKKWLFNPIDEPDQKVMAEVMKIMSEADTNNINNGMALPEELRKSRFNGGFSVETQLDDAAYMQELALDRIADEQATTPTTS